MGSVASASSAASAIQVVLSWCFRRIGAPSLGVSNDQVAPWVHVLGELLAQNFHPFVDSFLAELCTIVIRFDSPHDLLVVGAFGAEHLVEILDSLPRRAHRLGILTVSSRTGGLVDSQEVLRELLDLQKRVYLWQRPVLGVARLLPLSNWTRMTLSCLRLVCDLRCPKSETGRRGTSAPVTFCVNILVGFERRLCRFDVFWN